MNSDFRTVEECARCKSKMNHFTMSWFNREFICMPCRRKEEQHPDIELAKAAEINEVRKGNYNYEGIGYPGENERVSDEFKEELLRCEECSTEFCIDCFKYTCGCQEPRYQCDC